MSQAKLDRLMERSELPPGCGDGACGEVRRGMAIADREGIVVGQVAGVRVGRSGRATHVLHMCFCPEPEYRLVPVSAVAHCGATAIRLKLSGAALHALPRGSALASGTRRP